MKTLVRIGFVALIALGLGSQALRAGRGDGDTNGALADRLGQMRIAATAWRGSGLLLARSPLCSQPFVVGLVQSDGADDELFRQLTGPDVVVRYAYLGAVEDRPSRTALLARWGVATVLFHAGLRPARPSQQVVVVAYPRSCVELETTDWSVLSP